MKTLADSISTLGLLNPVILDQERALIAGLHRLEAVKLLGWTEIECTVSSLEGLSAELAEIDENFIRRDLTMIERGNLLLRRKELYEALHPETTQGGDRKSEKIKTTKCRFDPVKPFCQDTAEKTGVSRRTIERHIQIARDLTPEAKKVVGNAKVSQMNILKLSLLPPEQQEEAARQLVTGEIQSVDEYCQTSTEPERLEDTSTSELSVQQETESEEHVESETPTVPFTLGTKKYATIRESIADLKNPDKDCSCTPDGFLAEITAFVQKFLRDIEWYSTPYYEAVYPSLSPVQREYLRQQLDSVRAGAKTLFKRIEGKQTL